MNKPNHPLRRWRFAHPKRVPLRHLAEMAGCSIGHLAGIENGARLPSLPVAVKLHQITGIPVEAFVLPLPGKAA